MKIRQVSFSERKNSQNLLSEHLPSIDHKEGQPHPTAKERRVTYKDVDCKKRDAGLFKNNRRSSKDIDSKLPTDIRRSSKDADSKLPTKEKKHSAGALLINAKQRASQVYRDLRMKTPVDPGDRAELFIMQSHSPRWRSCWTGPL